MAYTDLIIKDDEFQSGAKHFEAFHGTLLEAVKEYRAILNNISTNAIRSGRTHDALVEFLNYVSNLEEIVDALSGRCETIVEKFLSEIDEADDYLYEENSSIARDFTDEFYRHLCRCLDDPWSSITDSFGDWLYGKFLDILDFLGLDKVKSELNQCHRLLLDYNDEVEQGLKYIFDRVHSIDRAYGHSIANGFGTGDYYTCAFSYIVLTMCAIRDDIDVMAEIMSKGRADFSVKIIAKKLDQPYQELKKYYDQVVLIAEETDKPTDEEIAAFAEQQWAELAFECYSYPLNDYLANIDGWDEFLVILFNMFGIAEDKITATITEEIRRVFVLRGFNGVVELLKKEGLILVTNPTLFLPAVSEENYDIYLKRKQILQMMQQVSDGYNFSETEEAELLDQYSTVIKYAKKYGDAWYEKLYNDKALKRNPMLKTSAEKFKEFLDSVKNAKEILKYGEAGIEYITRLFADYSAGLEVLESLERNVSGDDNYQRVLAEIKALYNKQFNAWAAEAGETVVEFGIDAALDALKKASPVGAVIEKIEKVLDVGGEMTGLGTKGQKLYESFIQESLYNTSYLAYKSALQKVKKLNPGTAEYEQALMDLKNCFEVHKQDTVNLYKAMAETCTGEQSAYYKYCAKEAERMTMKTNTKPDIMSYEEFRSSCGNGGSR